MATQKKFVVKNGLISQNNVDITGNLAISGTVDGRDIATDGAKLDNVAVGATAYGDSNVASYLGSNGYGTSSSIIASITDSAPGTLDTLNELAAALGDDANFSTTVTNSIATKLPLAGGTITGDVSFTNGNKAVFGGTGNGELEIYAHSTNNNVYISENGGSGNLNLGADNFNIYTNAFTKQVASFTAGSAKLLNDGNEKLATTATGINVTGNATFGDNNRAIFGSSNDLNIRHDPTNGSMIENINSTSTVTFRTNGPVMQWWDTQNGGYYIHAARDGAVSLAYARQTKFATTPTGIDVTGTVVTDGLTTNGAAVGDTYFTGGTANSRLLNVFTSTQDGAANAGHNFKIASGLGAFIFGNNTTANLLTVKTGGIDVTGVITTDGMTTSADINFGDDDKALFGAGNDLKIYHSANNQSYIHEVGSGDLNILATNLKLQDAGGSTKVLVNSTGINVTGTVTADGLTVDSGAGNIGIVTKSTDQFAFIGFEDNTSATSSVYVGADGNDFIARANSITRFRAASNGDISFYEDTGTTAKFFWDASTERLGIGTTAPTNSLHVVDSGNIQLKLESSGTNANSRMLFSPSDGDKDWNIGANDNGLFTLYDGTTNVLSVSSTTVDVTGNITVSGTVDGRDVATDGTKLDGIATSANNYSHPNHTGEVTSTGDGAMVIADNVVDEANLKVSNSPTNGYFLSAQSGNTGGLTWSAVPAGYTDGDVASYLSTNGYGTSSSIIGTITDSAPGTLDTLNELAAALGDDANFSTTVTSSIATKLPLAGGTMTGNITFGDNDKAIFGAGSDLQIYHSGTNSFIDDAGTGNLQIRASSQIKLQKYTGENMFVGIADGAASMYYDNAQKIATTATGIDVTGTVTADGIFVDTDSIYSVSGTNRVGINKTSPATTLDVGGSIFFSSILRSTTGGSESSPSIQPGLDGDTGMFWPAVNNIGFTTAGTERMRIDASGNVGIGTGSSVTNSTLNVNGGINITTGIIGYATNDSFTLNGRTQPHYGCNFTGSSGNPSGISGYYGISFAANGAEKMRIDSAGRLLLGKTAVDNTTVGFRFDGSSGFSSFVRDGGEPLYLNRKTSDGEILKFAKDGTIVGSIGSLNSGEDLYINSTDDLSLQAGGNSGLVIFQSGGSLQNITVYTHFLPSGTNDIGASGAKWRHLHLSGNVNVDGTVDGRDVATDGAKLDGIETGATADQTAAQILTAIKTVDGASSGLDADTVDGIQASQFLRSDADDQTTNVLSVGNASGAINGEKLRVSDTGTFVASFQRTDGTPHLLFKGTGGTSGHTGRFYMDNGAFQLSQGNATGSQSGNIWLHGNSSGHVGIGTTSPSGELHVLGTSGGNGDLYVGRTSGAELLLQAQSANGKIGTSSNHNLGLNTNGTTRITIDTAGDVGIGTTPYANARLTIGGTEGSGYPAVLQFDNNNTSGAEFFMLATDTNWTAGANKFVMGHGASSSSNVDVTIDSSGQVGINDYTPSYRLDVNGDIRATGDVITDSDIRFKSNVRPISKALSTVCALSGKIYSKDDKDDQIGLIAQDVEKILPQMVHTASDEIGTKSVNYQNMVAILIEAIKEQNERIDKLTEMLESK